MLERFDEMDFWDELAYEFYLCGDLYGCNIHEHDIPWHGVSGK